MQGHQLLVPESMNVVVRNQKQRLESKQWTYTWQGKPQKVRDNVESVLRTVQQASGLISAGMTMAPVYVSLPWSMISILIPFVLNDFKVMSSAVDGLKEVTSVMASYSYAEKEFLLDAGTQADFIDVVVELYAAILGFQASAGLYFGKSTLKRLGISVSSTQSWTDAIADVRAIDHRRRVSLTGLEVKLNQRNFQDVTALLQQGAVLMQQISKAVSTERTRRQQIVEWISPINPIQDHADVRRLLGDDYFASGQWLLTDGMKYLPWKSSDSGILLLQGGMGTGKSSLVSMVVQDLMLTSMSRVAFVYCSANASPSDPSRTVHNDTLNILRCILAQCATLPDGSVAEAVQSAFDASSRQRPGDCDFSLGTTVQYLQEVISEHPEQQVTVVVDALDECVAATEVLAKSVEVRRAVPNVRVFLSARPGVTITPPFDADGYEDVSVGGSNSDDVRAYVDSEVMSRYGNSGMTKQQADRFAAALKDLAEGMFRWVVLEIDILLPRFRKQGSRQMSKDIERRLVNLEQSLAPIDERLMTAYDDILAAALGAEDELSRRYVVESAIKWVLYAVRHLSATELVCAVSAYPDGSIEEDATEEIVLEYCSNFLVKTLNGSVRLAHLSVRQFFDTRRSVDFAAQPSHELLGLVCLQVYWPDRETPSQELLAAGANRSRSVVGKGQEAWSDYCCQNWPLHYRMSSKGTPLSAQLDRFEQEFRGRDDRMLLWIAKTPDLAAQDALGNNGLHSMVMSGQYHPAQVVLRAARALDERRILHQINVAGNTVLHCVA